MFLLSFLNRQQHRVTSAIRSGLPFLIRLNHMNVRYGNAINYPYSLIYSSVAIRTRYGSRHSRDFTTYLCPSWPPRWRGKRLFEVGAQNYYEGAWMIWTRAGVASFTQTSCQSLRVQALESHDWWMRSLNWSLPFLSVFEPSRMVRIHPRFKNIVLTPL